MSDENASRSRLSEKGRAQLDERRDRQARALRDNLRKRKAQLRAREQPDEGAPSGTGPGGKDPA